MNKYAHLILTEWDQLTSLIEAGLQEQPCKLGHLKRLYFQRTSQIFLNDILDFNSLFSNELNSKSLEKRLLEKIPMFNFLPILPKKTLFDLNLIYQSFFLTIIIFFIFFRSKQKYWDRTYMNQTKITSYFFFIISVASTGLILHTVPFWHNLEKGNFYSILRSLQKK